MRAPGADRSLLGGGLHARVVTLLGRAIVEGEYIEGQVLDLDAISTDLGVSRSVLREALRVLQSLGMVEPRPRLGTQVLSRIDWDLMNPQIIDWRGQGREYYAQMRELLELRLGIEPIAAGLSAKLMTDDQIAAVQESADAMMTAHREKNGKQFLDADIAFHSQILRGSGNDVIGHFSGTVEAVLRTRTQEKRLTITNYTPSSAERHNELALALARRDADAAYDWARMMIAETLDEFVSEANASS